MTIVNVLERNDKTSLCPSKASTFNKYEIKWLSFTFAFKYSFKNYYWNYTKYFIITCKERI